VERMSKHRAGSVPDRVEGAALTGTAGQESLFEPPATPEVKQIEPPKADALFKVLFVCTGNIHRSVMGERLMRSRIRPRLPVPIRSAGTQAAVDYPIGEYSAIALKELGADPEDHKPQQLQAAVAASADLILTAELEHRQIVLLETPSALRRTFSLREFARLAEQVEPLRPTDPFDIDTLRAQVLLVSAQRGLAPRTTRSEDIADPVGASLKETRQRASEIAECVDVVIRTFGLGSI
jgi:protein-tyrosine phosphatase